MGSFIRTASFVLLGAAALTGACKKAPPPPPVQEQAPPPPPAPLAVTTVDLGKGVDADKRISAPATQFGLRDTIYASVATTGVASTATLAAKWTFGTGQLVDSTSVTIAPTGPANTEFHIIKKSAWPVGKYKVSILLNNAVATEKEFEVKK